MEGKSRDGVVVLTFSVTGEAAASIAAAFWNKKEMKD